MAKLALFVRLDAKTGKEREVEALLQSVLPMVSAEPGTHSWCALKMAPQMYGMFDTFDNESDRETHLSGPVAKALTQRASELLSRPPVIERVQILGFLERGAPDLAAVPPPAKDPRAPETMVTAPAPEVPKVGSQDAPGG
jgi:quinol monooxygenase YgiN